MKLRPHQSIHRMAALSLIGLLVGMITSVATIGFIETIHFFNQLLKVSPDSRLGLDSSQLAMFTIAALTFGGLLVGLLLQYATEKGAVHGPADAIYAVQLRERLPPAQSGAASTLAVIFSLGCGASVGQYGPLVYLGALVGQLTNRLHLGIRDIRSITIACGVAAAISTAFNAPIAALIFTHEVILRHYSLRMFAAVTVASACGYVVANVIFHYPPLFLIEFDKPLHATEFLLFALEGIFCGFIAVIFMRLLSWSMRLSKSLRIPAACKPMLAGFLVSLVALQVPEVLGIGQEVFRQASVSGHYTAEGLLLILVCKLLATVICLGFGFAGGVMSPSLLIGLMFGALFALLVPEYLLEDYSGLAVYAICGMVAVMSPVIGAPMTALLLVFEFTRNYEITIAAMVAIVFANLVSNGWYGRSFFDVQLLERGVDLSQGRLKAYLMHHSVSEYATQALPRLSPSARLSELREKMKVYETGSAVVIDDDGIYLGQVFQHQISDIGDDSLLSSLKYDRQVEFKQNTSIWEAMDIMRGYLGDAIVVVDSDSGKYLGVIPESVVIGAYLDAAQDLRREEHEA